MKFWKLLLIIIIVCCSKNVFAQERVDHRKMNYFTNPKPNSIIYNDSLYKGASQFSRLFYRTHDIDLINLYQRHQSNKIWGTALGVVGTLATTIGVIMATSYNNNVNNNTAGWITAGSGLACSIFGAHLIQSGQRNLLMAVEIFNQKYNRATGGIGVSGSNAGFVVNF